MFLYIGGRQEWTTLSELHVICSKILINSTAANRNLTVPCPVLCTACPLPLSLKLCPSAAPASHMTLIYSLPCLSWPMMIDQGWTSDGGVWPQRGMSVTWYTSKKELDWANPIPFSAVLWLCTEVPLLIISRCPNSKAMRWKGEKG